MFKDFFNTQLNYIRAVRENFGHAEHEEVSVKPVEQPTKPTEPENPSTEEGTETQTVKKTSKKVKA